MLADGISRLGRLGGVSGYHPALFSISAAILRLTTEVPPVQTRTRWSSEEGWNLIKEKEVGGGNRIRTGE
jgi:hypothetical protein